MNRFLTDEDAAKIMRAWSPEIDRKPTHFANAEAKGEPMKLSLIQLIATKMADVQGSESKALDRVMERFNDPSPQGIEFWVEIGGWMAENMWDKTHQERIAIAKRMSGIMEPPKET